MKFYQLVQKWLVGPDTTIIPQYWHCKDGGHIFIWDWADSAPVLYDLWILTFENKITLQIRSRLFYFEFQGSPIYSCIGKRFSKCHIESNSSHPMPYISNHHEPSGRHLFIYLSMFICFCLSLSLACFLICCCSFNVVGLGLTSDLKGLSILLKVISL